MHTSLCKDALSLSHFLPSAILHIRRGVRTMYSTREKGQSPLQFSDCGALIPQAHTDNVFRHVDIIIIISVVDFVLGKDFCIPKEKLSTILAYATVAVHSNVRFSRSTASMPCRGGDLRNLNYGGKSFMRRFCFVVAHTLA